MSQLMNEFWDNLNFAQSNGTFCFKDSSWNEIDIEAQKSSAISKIEAIIVKILRDVESLKSPTIQYNSRSGWQNVIYVEGLGMQLRRDCATTTVSLYRSGSGGNFGLIMKVLCMIYRLILTNQTATKRDLYYSDPALFKSQTSVNHIVDDIACMLEVPRYVLNVGATSKGIVAGDLQFSSTDGNAVDCRDVSTGLSIPGHIQAIGQISSESARFILVVEKDASFQRLLEDELPIKLSCIMITGKGVPDVDTRMFTKLLSDVLHIPVFGLFDADPHGIEIMCIYRFGSMSLAYDSTNLAVDNFRWIGLLPTDVATLGLLRQSVIPFTDRDAKKCRELLTRPYMVAHPEILNQVKLIQTLQCKAELQALELISQSYLSETYLPSKIQMGEWV